MSRKFVFLILVFSLVPGVAELQAATYVEGHVARMHSVPCGTENNNHMCQAYVVRTDTMMYRIRQEKPKNQEILPVGQEIYFRVKKNRMEVRGFTLNGHKINNQEYIILSERQRGGRMMPPGAQ